MRKWDVRYYRRPFWRVLGIKRQCWRDTGECWLTLVSLGPLQLRWWKNGSGRPVFRVVPAHRDA